MGKGDRETVMNKQQRNYGAVMNTKTRFGLALTIILLTSGAFVAYGAKEQEPALDSEMEKLSYTMGLQSGRSLVAQGVDIDAEVYLRGLKDGRSGEQPLLTEEQVREAIVSFRTTMTAKRQEQIKKLAQDNKSEGEAFLAENAKKEGVVTLPSGLQYKVIKAGTGKKPTEGDTVTMNYQGKLVNGTEFGNSSKRGKPESFQLNRVIKGWKEALPLMEEGAQWQVVIPPGLAYGEKGGPKGSGIGPNATLIFDVELVSAEKKPSEQSAAPAETKAPRGSAPGKAKG